MSYLPICSPSEREEAAAVMVALCIMGSPSEGLMKALEAIRAKARAEGYAEGLAAGQAQ